jgi:hypothetical protein
MLALSMKYYIVGTQWGFEDFKSSPALQHLPLWKRYVDQQVTHTYVHRCQGTHSSKKKGGNLQRAKGNMADSKRVFK